MNVILTPSKLRGEIEAIPSKSMAHRLLICAALSDGTTKVRCNGTSEDIEATISCLKAMGSNILRIGDSYLVPKITVGACDAVSFNCGESGTTLRFMMCIAAGIGLRAKFDGSDRLFERPLEPLIKVLTDHGIVISRDERNRIIQSGKAFLPDYEIEGNISSQYISGLMLMLPLCGGGRVKVTGSFESKPYVTLTMKALQEAGVKASEEDNTYSVYGKYALSNTDVEGDWSNAGFFLVASALGSDVTVKGLDVNSSQGDRETLSVLEKFGCENLVENGVKVRAKELKAQTIDVSDIPDAVPILSVLASVSKGETHIVGAKRLRLKESDRLLTVANMINNLGGDAEIVDDSLVIRGKDFLAGGRVEAEKDHRIAMSAAIASTVSKGEVEIIGAEAVNKSYPKFFEDLVSLGAHIERRQ